MRIFVIGGSGKVAGLILPLLRERHTLRIFDRRPPSLPDVDFVLGDATDFEAVARAAAGYEALLYMAMGRYLPIGKPYADNVETLTSSMDANVKGLFLSLAA